MFFLLFLASLDPINGDLFKHLYFTYSIEMYRIAMNRVSNKEDAEDVVQDTYRKVFQNIKRFYDLDEESTVKLLIIYTVNTAKDLLRKKSRRIKAISLEYEEDEEEKTYEIPDTSEIPEDVFIKKEAWTKMASLIDELSEAQRHAIILKYSYRMCNREIAKILCISETAVSSRLSRARIALKKKMEVEYYGQNCKI